MTGRLICPDPGCDNREEFACGHILHVGTLLDGRGRVFDQVERSRSSAGFDVTCARCGAVVVASRARPASEGAPPYERWLTAVIEELFCGGLSAEALGTEEAEAMVRAVLARAEGGGGLPSYATGGSRSETERKLRRLLEAVYRPLTRLAVYADVEGALGTVLVVDLRRASGDYPGRLARRVLLDLESLPGFARDGRGLQDLYEKARSFANVGDAARGPGRAASGGVARGGGRA